MSQKSKLMQWIDYRVRITTQDGKMFVGTFLAFDKHLNVVLVDTEEFRRVKNKKKTGDGMNIEVGDREEKRILGMIILRGQNIVSFTAEKPPTLHDKKQDKAAAGPGKAAPITRPIIAAGANIVPNQAPGMLPPKGLGQGAPANMMPMMPPMPPMQPGMIPGVQPNRPMGMIPGQPPMMMPPGMQFPPQMPPGAKPPGPQ